jgi:hypothetical protein
MVLVVDGSLAGRTLFLSPIADKMPHKMSRIVSVTRSPNNVAAKHVIQSKMKPPTALLLFANDGGEKKIAMRAIPRINSINNIKACP